MAHTSRDPFQPGKNSPRQKREMFGWMLGCGAWISFAWLILAPGETRTFTIPGQEMRADSEDPALLVWSIPAEWHSWLPPSRWVNNSSTLLLNNRLIPLDRNVQSPRIQPIPGWGAHRLRDHQLEVMLPEDLRITENTEIRLGLNADVSLSRSVALLLFSGCLFSWTYFRRCSDQGTWLRRTGQILVYLAPLVAFLGFYCTPGTAVPPAWRGTLPIRALQHLESLAPGLFLLLVISAWLGSRRSCPKSDSSGSERRLLLDFLRYGWVVSVTLLMFSWIRIGACGLEGRNDWNHGLSYAPFHACVSYSDAQGYLDGACRMRHAQPLDEFNQRRPINVSYYTLLLLISGDRIWLARWLQTLLIALACGATARQIAATHGLWAGLAGLGFLWGLSRSLLPLTSSEPLGFLLGCLATCALLRGLRTRSLPAFLAGLAFLGLGQASRPGALLVLPLMGLASASACKSWKTRGQVVGVSAVIVALALSINSALLALYGTGVNQSGANFAYTFAGLASGHTWSEVMQQQQQQLDALETEKEKAAYLYRLGWKNIQEHPGVLIKELLRAEYLFCLYSPHFLLAISLREAVFYQKVFFLPWLLAFTGLAFLSCRRVCLVAGRSELPYWIAFFAGLLGSVAIVFLDGSFRSLTATWPLFFTFVVSGLRGARVPAVPESHPSWHGSRWMEMYSVGGFVVLILAAIGASQQVWPLPASGESAILEDDGKTWFSLHSPLANPLVRIEQEPGEFSFVEWQKLIQFAGLEYPEDFWKQAPRGAFCLRQCYLPEWNRTGMLIWPGSSDLPKGAKIRIYHTAESEWAFYVNPERLDN
ncbi:MAG: hypothetical protein R3C12_05665 [Planctomycetaceae bacterium]|nr:hypothetical protein [Planctomycetaceae bacterium]